MTPSPNAVNDGHSGAGTGGGGGGGAKHEMPTIEKIFQAVSLIHAAYNSYQNASPPPAITEAVPSAEPELLQSASSANSPSDIPLTGSKTEEVIEEKNEMINFQMSSTQYAALVNLLGGAILDLAPGTSSFTHGGPLLDPPSLASSAGRAQSGSLPGRPSFESLLSRSSDSMPPTTSQLAMPLPERAKLYPPTFAHFSRQTTSLPTPEPEKRQPRVTCEEDVNGSNKFLKLPTEILSRIFREARTLSEDPRAWTRASLKKAHAPFGLASVPASVPISVPVASGPVPVAPPAGEEDDSETETEDGTEEEPEWPTIHAGGGAAGQVLITYGIHNGLGLGAQGGIPGGVRKIGGPLHAQGYAHALAGVSGLAMAIARKTAWEKLTISSRKQIASLIRAWKGEQTLGGAKEKGKGKKSSRATVAGSSSQNVAMAAAHGMLNAGQYVLEVDIQVPVATPAEAPKDLSRRAYLRRSTSLFTSITDLQARRRSALKNENLPRLLKLMPNLRTLSLSIFPIGQSRGGYGGGLSGLGFGLDGLEGELLSSICSLSSLTSLVLRQAIDFSELEVLLPCLPELKELRLQGGFQNTDGQTLVDPDAVHSCKLKRFILYLASTNLTVSSAQLDWILSPSAGTIVELDMVFWTRPDVNGMWGGMMVEGGGDNAQTRWASKILADLLVRLGPTLRVFAIRGCSFAGVTDPSLLAEPHRGSFDYALSFCPQLRHLAIDWSVTGPDLLHSITTGPSPDSESDADLASPSPTSPTTEITPASTNDQTITTELQAEPTGSPIGIHLKTLTLFGRPRHISAKMMRETLENTSPPVLPSLNAITLAEFPTRQVHSMPWPSRELRKLQAICRKRDIWFGITT